jgi:hypothetical protein
VYEAGELLPAVGDRAVHARGPLEGRLRRLEQRTQVRPAALQPLAARVREHGHVPAGVRVEVGEHLVRVHVRGRLRDADPVAVAQAPAVREPGLGAAGVELDRHVVQPGLRTQIHRRIAVDRPDLVGFELEGHDGKPVLGLDLRDLAHLDAGDGDVLTLAG